MTIKKYELEFLRKWSENNFGNDTVEDKIIISKICNNNIIDINMDFIDVSQICIIVCVCDKYFKIFIESKSFLERPFFLEDKSIDNYYIEEVLPYKKVGWLSVNNSLSLKEKTEDDKIYDIIYSTDKTKKVDDNIEE